jgi:hypothetical protein
MGFLEKLKKFFASTGGASASLLDVVVRCNRCGEIIHGQINLRNDLSIEYDSDDVRYFCRKGLVGSGANRCFQTVVVEYTFDANRNVVDRRVEGGTFVDKGA